LFLHAAVHATVVGQLPRMSTRADAVEDVCVHGLHSLLQVARVACVYRCVQLPAAGCLSPRSHANPRVSTACCVAPARIRVLVPLSANPNGGRCNIGLHPHACTRFCCSGEVQRPVQRCRAHFDSGLRPWGCGGGCGRGDAAVVGAAGTVTGGCVSHVSAPHAGGNMSDSSSLYFVHHDAEHSTGCATGVALQSAWFNQYGAAPCCCTWQQYYCVPQWTAPAVALSPRQPLSYVA